MAENSGDKMRQMEEEMNRFEAEIANQASVTSSTVPVVNNLTNSAITLLPTQVRAQQQSLTAFVTQTTPLVSVPPIQSSVPLYVPMVQPTAPAYQVNVNTSTVPYATTPFFQAHRTVVTHITTPNTTTKSAMNKSAANRTVAPPKTVITAPPQMAGPDELASRARQAAAAAVAAKSKNEQDDDDDVTRALLAAAAGVTYTRISKPGGKETVMASITKPPLTPVMPVNTAGGNVVGASDTTEGNVPMPLFNYPPPAVPVTYRSTSTTTYPGQKKKKYLRTAAGSIWEDPTLSDWDPNDFRLFCGDLGNEVNDDTLTRAFNRYPSFQKARVIRDKRTDKSRGYGFVSFSDPNDFNRALREMNGKYVGNRPIKLKKSDWKTRQLEVQRKREKEKRKLGLKI